MALKNKSMYAILGILNLSPGTGYDVKRYSDQVLSGFWHENFGHIYPTLRMLRTERMIEIVDGKSDEKKIVYAITDKGRAELKAWLTEDTALQPVRSEFLLKLLFSSDLPGRDVTRMLKKYREQHIKSTAKYREMQRALERGIQGIPPARARFLNAVIKNGIASGDAVIQWCDEAIAEFERA